MPHYECRECGKLYDPVTVVKCPHCGESHPLNCSKCDKKINHHDIYGLEKLKTKKPLLCEECGYSTEVIKCSICKISLVRSKGFSASNAPNAKVYHRACYDKRIETIEFAKQWAQPAMAVLGVIGGLLGYGLTLKGIISAGAIGAIGFGAVMGLAELIKPR